MSGWVGERIGWVCRRMAMTTLGVLRRGKLISRVDNHIIWLEPFLKYNMGPFSWLYERMRPINGKLFGLAGPPPAQVSPCLCCNTHVLYQLLDKLQLASMVCAGTAQD